MARIVLGTYLVRYPLGGMMSWALQYIIGLHRMGHHVVVVESATYPDACFDPVTRDMTDDPTHGLSVVEGLLRRFEMPGRLCFVDVEGRHHGLNQAEVREAFRTADVFVDMGTHGSWQELAELAGRRVLIDGEPGFTQLKRENARIAGAPVAEYDGYWTSGINVGTSRSPTPSAGVLWQPLPHPVVLDLFPVTAAPAGGPITTVMNWQSYAPVEHEGQTYGHKDRSFEVFADLPRRVDAALELAVAGPAVPNDRLNTLGWRTRDGHEVTRTLDAFWDYIRASRAEFSLCKEGYVSLRTGWFSDRGGAYMASGRPVVQQDTGFGDVLPCGEGLFAVTTVEAAATALESVLRDPVAHGRAARAIAEQHLASERVLGPWLEAVLG